MMDQKQAFGDNDAVVISLTIRLLTAGLRQILSGSLGISHLQSGHSCSVQCFDIIWSPLQHTQAVVLYPSVVNVLFLQQTG